MNTFTLEITPEGFTETLVYKGKTYTKRYKKDGSGWRGLDKAWEYTEGIPDDLAEALEGDDECEIMDALAIMDALKEGDTHE